MKTKLLKAYNASIVSLLAILGFITCVNAGCAKYGSPATMFIVNGNVSCKETRQPIPNIRVTTGYVAAFTDSVGHYEIVNWTHISQIQFRDTTEKYKALDTLIELKEGETKTLNVQLTPRQTND